MFSLLPLAAPHLKAGAWPQDNLKRIWHKSGIPIDYRNRHIVSRDYYALVGGTPPLNNGQSSSITAQVGQDGDFWIASMAFWSVPHFGNLALYLPIASVQIVDNSSGYKLFEPSVRLSFLCGEIPSQVVPQSNGTFVSNTNTFQPYVRTSLPQPYPILRDSSITVTITMIARDQGGGANPPAPIYFSLDGWKEYQNAAGQ